MDGARFGETREQVPPKGLVAESGVVGVGQLELHADGDHLAGHYILEHSTLTFESTPIAEGIVDVVIYLHGMALAATIDTNRRVAEVDGFGTELGSDTQMTAQDREVLSNFYAGLEARVDRDAPEADALVRATSLWAQTSDSLPLQRSIAGDTERAWTSLCSLYLSYFEAAHDDFSPCFNGAGSGNQCISNALVGYRNSNMYYLVNGSWTTTVQNHKPLVKEKGQCFGNCGANCPSGNQTLSLDCHDHDQCVRNGHSLLSAFCDDEFVAASDDEIFAPTCSGTG